jgi:hypothetical protein
MLTAAWPVWGADTPAPGQKPAASSADALAAAARIDELLAARWAKAEIQPAARTDDAEFCRRIYLDLAGRIPAVAEVRAFLADKSPDKRSRLVDTLLDGPRYVTHFKTVWRSIMLPETNSSFQGRFLTPAFEEWLKKQLAANARYDDMARELLTLPINNNANRLVFGPNQGEPTPAAYYLAKEVKPENLAAGTARLFLGVRLECAQCHNHPFATWKREQFWSYAAFFSGLQSTTRDDFIVSTGDSASKREITIPGSDKVVQAVFLDGKVPQWKDNVSSRKTLADWVTAADNPYFARATVNRLWFNFFGTGLVDPVDEMVGAETIDSAPEVLNALAKEFVAHRYDLKYLVRVIVNTRAYQLTSTKPDQTTDDPHQFARMAVRGMTAEQLYDSVTQATGYADQVPAGPRNFFNNGSPRDEFLARFASQSERPTESQTSILQALSLMNGRIVSDATSLERSETLAAVLDAPFLDTTGRIETLYLATLARQPRPKETARLAKFIEATVAAAPSADGDKAYKQAVADVLWALLNNGEFILNH